MNYPKGTEACDTLVRAPERRTLTDVDDGEVATPVTMPHVAGVRLLGAVPTGGPVVRIPAVTSDERSAELVLVTAGLDAALRRRIRTESADLEAALARLPGVLPLIDHGVDSEGRPYLLAARPGPSPHETLATDGPRSLPEVLAIARATAEGLRVLASYGLIGPPPVVRRGGGGELMLAAPLPPALVELESAFGDGTGHEPPEVLAGEDWAPAGQAYACASMFWTLLAGRPPYAGRDRLARLMGDAPPPVLTRPDVPEAVTTVLRTALAHDPAARPSDPVALAGALAGAAPAPDPESNPTIPPRRQASPSGTPLGSRYELVHRIGGGASGQVWEGRRLDDDLRIAVKILRSELSEDPGTIDRFLRESRMLQSIDHPNVVRIYDFVKEGDVFGIVMELIDGEDLRHVAARGRVRVTEAAELLAQTASALAAVHAAGIVHRDVKPENVLVTERNGRRTAFLSDFGIARAIAGSAHTQLLGTPAYLGPELWAGRSPTAATDIYAMGIMAYELLAGRLPFEATTHQAMMRAHLEQPVLRPDGVDDVSWTLITACLDRDPGRRPDAAQVAARWAGLAGSAVLGALTIPPPARPGAAAVPSERDPALGTVMSARPLQARPEPPAVKRRRRRGPIIAGLAGTVIIGVGGGVALATRHHTAAPAPSRTTPAPSVRYYPVASSIKASGATSAALSWSRQTGSLPGFGGYLVSDVSGGKTRPVSQVLSKDVHSFAVHDLHPGHRSCFLVIALVSTPPPGPPAQPSCITPHTARRGGTAPAPEIVEGPPDVAIPHRVPSRRHRRAGPRRRRQRRAGPARQDGGDRAGADLPARRRTPAHRGRPRHREDLAGQGARRELRRQRAPHPVHPGPAADRHHRRVRVGPRVSAFEFRPGPVFANVVIADEINRASPKTQSALLEVMEEAQVTVDGVAHPVPTPFLVVATQNPIDMEGTYRLPEAQLDRFLMRIGLGHPSPAVEEEILAGRARSAPPVLSPVISAENLARAQAAISSIHVAPEIARYVATIAQATREHDALRLAVSTRGSLALLRAAQAYAACAGRHYVVPDDVKATAGPVLTHRLVLAAQAEVRGATTAAVLGEVLDGVRVPALSTSTR